MMSTHQHCIAYSLHPETTTLTNLSKSPNFNNKALMYTLKESINIFNFIAHTSELSLKAGNLTNVKLPA